MSGDEAYKRFLDGDQSAFEEIVKEYRYGLTCFVAGIVHDFAAAEDIAADAFARLLIKKGAFGFRSSLKTYLFAIAKNRATDWLRKQKHTAEPTEDLADKTLLEDQLFRDEKRKTVNTCLARIKDDYRQVLYLLFFEEMSYEQAAQVLKKSKKQIDNLAFRGKQALKKELEKEESAVLDDKEFLDKIRQKADKQKKDRTKKRRHLAAAGSCLALFLLAAVFIFPNTAVKDKSLSNGTGCSEEYDGKEADSFPDEPAPEFTSDENQPEIVCSPPFSEAILITTAEKATEQGLHRAEPFFEEKALLLFTAEEYPEQTDCEIQAEQRENSLQITVTPSQNTEVKAKTQFLLEINKTDLQKTIRIIQKKEAQP